MHLSNTLFMANRVAKRAKVAMDIAYLGPAGTYGEQAAKRFAQRLGGGANLVPCPTIKSIYDHPADYLVMPLENTIHGPVEDTVDSLLSVLNPSTPQSKPHPKAVADTSLRIEHQLVAKKGTRLSDVKWVRSHEQALGQSSAWLDKHLPNAKRVPWASTAGAVESLFHEAGNEGAAIGSKVAFEQWGDKLVLLHAGTQAVKNNFTRFLLLTRNDIKPPGHDGKTDEAEQYEALKAPTSHTVATFVATTSARHSWNESDDVRAILQRPAPADIDLGAMTPPFPRRYLVEVDLHELASQTYSKDLKWVGTVYTDDAESERPESESRSEGNGHGGHELEGSGGAEGGNGFL